MAGDLDNLVDMGFDKEKAEIALKKGGNLTGAIDWLDKNADKSIDEIKQADAASAEEDSKMPDVQPGEEAKSMQCDDCGKKFRSMTQVQFHAERSGHENFSQSAEELAPLTEMEKKQRLEELRAKLAEKRAGQAAQDKLEQKRNEEIRRKHTKESDDAKEDLQRREQIKEAQQKRKEKQADAAAKQRIKDKIEADKLARKQKAEEEKAMRANPSAYNPGAATVPSGAGGIAAAAAAAAAGGAPKANHSDARLKLQTPEGIVMKTLPAETTLFELAEAVRAENGTQATTFSSNFPRKTFNYEDFGMTLKEAGFVPSASLSVK